MSTLMFYLAKHTVSGLLGWGPKYNLVVVQQNAAKGLQQVRRGSSGFRWSRAVPAGSTATSLTMQNCMCDCADKVHASDNSISSCPVLITSLPALQVSQLVAEGKLKPTIAKVYPLSEAADAQEVLETGHVRGKLVLEVAPLK